MRAEQLVPYFLMASYLYYEIHQNPPISDDEYDDICKRLYDEWDGVEHQHKHLIEREALKSGTGFYISNYPILVKNAAVNWMESYK
jgi:NAD-dependent DNA ligase